MNKQEQLNTISQYVRGLLQEKFGQSIDHCEAFIGSRYLMIYIRGFISPIEHALLSGGNLDTVAASRTVVIQTLVHEMKGVFQLQLGVRISEFYNDWNYDNNTGMILALLEDEQEFSHPPEGWNQLEEFKTDVVRLSEIIQKVPEQTQVIPLTPRILVAQRDGILIILEKALLAKGYEKQLRVTKAELEKEYFYHHAQFETIIGKQLSDVFIDWNLKTDRSLMCFVWE